MANERLQYMVWVKSLKVMASTADWYLIEQSGCLSSHGPMSGVQRENEEDHIVLRSTGVKDKKGKMIFESEKISEYDGIIVFKEGAFYVDHIHKNGRKYTLLSEWIRKRDKAGVGTEVIGNIHQDKHLLEGK